MFNSSRRRLFKASLASFLAGGYTQASFAEGQAWGNAAPLPLNTQELYPSVHKGRLYVAGGIASKLGVPYFTDRCVSYDPTTNEWRDEADLPEPLHHAALVSNGDRLFLVGGFNGGINHIWRMRDQVYELQEDKWVAINRLPQAQAEGVLSLAQDGALHLVTGQSPLGEANSKRSDHSEVTTHLRWDPNDETWETRAPIPTPRNSATGGWIDNQLVVAGGRTANGNLDETEIYDLDSDKWRTAAPLPLPQAGTASTIVDDGLIVFGGEIFVPNAAVFAEVWRYSLSADKWQSLPDMLTPRHGIGAGRFGDKIYVVGGATSPSGRGTSNANEVLDLSAL